MGIEGEETTWKEPQEILPDDKQGWEILTGQIKEIIKKKWKECCDILRRKAASLGKKEE